MLEKGIPEDSQSIDITQGHEIAFWCVKFGCPPNILRQAVKKVGANPSDVERELDGSRAHGEQSSWAALGGAF